jgi:hypothetical protein
VRSAKVGGQVRWSCPCSCSRRIFSPLSTKEREASCHLLGHVGGHSSPGGAALGDRAALIIENRDIYEDEQETHEAINASITCCE